MHAYAQRGSTSFATAIPHEELKISLKPLRKQIYCYKCKGPHRARGEAQGDARVLGLFELDEGDDQADPAKIKEGGEGGEHIQVGEHGLKQKQRPGRSCPGGKKGGRVNLLYPPWRVNLPANRVNLLYPRGIE